MCVTFCQNDIPVFSPALTDGSVGDMLFFHSYKNPGLVLDIVEGKSTVTDLDWATTAVSALSDVHVMNLHFCLRYSQVEQPGGVGQKDRNDHPGRRADQTSYSQR